ncbi:MAG: carbohydrate deacetylase [Defluviitaleaceae bacterium]|nr:carbohydrate deacetylase [Defluviitaleaceae bacterium]
MKIIFNADDYGYSKGVNLGIIEAFQNGIVRSATMMANTPGFDHGVRLLESSPDLKIGVHLVLTHGRSLGGVYQTITDAKGNFLTLSELTNRANTGQIDLAEVEQEYTLQIQRILGARIRPTHFDGHHHTHLLPGILDITANFARKHDVALRGCNQQIPRGIKTVAFSDDFFGDNSTLEHLELMLSKCSADTEFFCHPAYVDSYLYKKSSYSLGRMGELETLTNPKAKEIIDKFGMTLATFADL